MAMPLQACSAGAAHMWSAVVTHSFISAHAPQFHLLLSSSSVLQASNHTPGMQDA
jgi:hypothetical protein